MPYNYANYAGIPASTGLTTYTPPTGGGNYYNAPQAMANQYPMQASGNYIPMNQYPMQNSGAAMGNINQMNGGWNAPQQAPGNMNMNQMNRPLPIQNAVSSGMNQMPDPMSQVDNTFEWVADETEARLFPLAPGASVRLMDSERPVMYKKTRDVSGKYYPMQIFDIVERVPGEVAPEIVYEAAASRGKEVRKAPVTGDVVETSRHETREETEYVKMSDLDALIERKVEAAVNKALA